MSANVEVVKKGFERFLAGDIPGFIELLSPDIEWDHRGPEGPPFNRMYNGRNGAAEFFKTLGESEEAIVFEPREYVGDGDRVLTLGYFKWKVKSTGKEWDSNFAFAYTVKDGLVTHWQPFFNLSAEAAAFRS